MLEHRKLLLAGAEGTFWLGLSSHLSTHRAEVSGVSLAHSTGFWVVLFLFSSVGIDLWKTEKIFIQCRQGDRYLSYEELFDELLVLSAFPIH